MRETLLLSGLLAALTLSCSAQSDLLFPHLRDVRQTLLRNPATPQRHRVSVGLAHGALAYHAPGFPMSVLTGEAPVATRLAAGVAGLPSTSRVRLEGRAEVLGLTLATRAGTFSFDLAQRGGGFVDVPAAGARYVFLGDRHLAAEAFEVDAYDAAGLSFLELGLGYAHALPGDERVRYGGRLKLLRGQGQGYVVEGRGETLTDAEGRRMVAAEGVLRSSGVAREGADSLTFARDFLLGAGNPGLALDLGLHYAGDDGVRLGISLLDLGGIRWRRFTQDYTFSGETTTPGLAGTLGPASTNRSALDTLTAQLDRVKAPDFAESTDYTQPYTRALAPAVLVTAGYPLRSWLDLTLSYAGRLEGGQLGHAASVGAVARWGHALQLGVAYGITEGVPHQLGISAAVELGPVQLFAASDDLLGLIDHDRLYATTLRAGLNVVVPEGGYGKLFAREAGRRGAHSRRVRCPKF